jgi:hypothetical protein
MDGGFINLEANSIIENAAVENPEGLNFLWSDSKKIGRGQSVVTSDLVADALNEVVFDEAYPHRVDFQPPET